MTAQKRFFSSKNFPMCSDPKGIAQGVSWAMTCLNALSRNAKKSLLIKTSTAMMTKPIIKNRKMKIFIEKKRTKRMICPNRSRMRGFAPCCARKIMMAKPAYKLPRSKVPDTALRSIAKNEARNKMGRWLAQEDMLSLRQRKNWRFARTGMSRAIAIRVFLC